ncbi:MAG: DUF4838 domain-containing protein [Kiritimatiellae bacterium]|nr:DUF4838 domain-containing protein [Kiritimatiellia bacterium]MBQ6330812.1 DUF4838 domain-containing protein [Kiritimatiellia bacterium]
MWKQISIVALAAMLPVCGIGMVVAERDGAPACRIYVRAHGESASYAASELVCYVEKMTGVRLPVVPEGAGAVAGRRIVLSASDGLGEDGFMLRSGKNEILIKGGKRGILYGVYEILERFGGCGWFSSWCEMVPKVDRFVVPDGLDETHRPAFPVRYSGWRDAIADIRFSARLRLNNQGWFPDDPRLGGTAFRFSKTLGPAHTFLKLLPPEKYFDEHPEWYSEVNGRRLKENTQLCLTNPEVLAAVITNVLEVVRCEPSARCFGVSQMDHYNFCTCKDCRALDESEGSHSATVIAFVNRIAEAVEHEFPGKAIETLAYQYTRKPPKTIRPRKGVIVCLCPMEVESALPIPEGRTQQTKSLRKDMEGWKRLGARLYVWDYDTNFTHIMLPHPYYGQMRENLRYYRANGVKIIDVCANYGGWHGEFAELKNYLFAKWSWDPELPMEPLLDRFFKGYYGAAAPMARKYFDDLIAYQMKAGNPVFGVYEEAGRLGGIYPEDFFRKAAEEWRRAEVLVKDDPVRLYNVKTTSMSTDYTIFMRECKDIFFSREDMAANAEARDALVRFAEKSRLADKAKHHVAICDGIRTSERKLAAVLARAEGGREIIGDGKTVVIEEKNFERTGFASSHVDVDDPEAIDGRAVRISNEFVECFTYLSLNRVAFRPGRKYRVTIRCKASLTGGDGVVFEPRIFDHSTRKFMARIRLGRKKIGAKYADIEVAEFVPGRDQSLDFAGGWWDKSKSAVNPAHDGIFVDRVTITEVEGE